MISDTFIIIQYFGEGRDSYAFMLLGMVGANMLDNARSTRSLFSDKIMGSKALQQYQKAHKKLKTGTKLTSAQVTDSGDSVFACVRATIRAPAGSVLAYAMDAPQKFLQMLNEEDEDLISEVVTERLNERHHIVVGRYKVPYPLTNRELVVGAIWEKVSEDEFFAVIVSCSRPNNPETDEYVRMTISRAYTIKRMTTTTASLEVVSKLEMGGIIPKRIDNTLFVPGMVAAPLNAMSFFATVRGKCDAGDARELGMLLVHTLQSAKGSEIELRKAIAKPFERIAVLRDLKARHDWVDEMFYHVIRNYVRPMAHIR